MYTNGCIQLSHDAHLQTKDLKQNKITNEIQKVMNARQVYITFLNIPISSSHHFHFRVFCLIFVLFFVFFLPQKKELLLLLKWIILYKQTQSLPFLENNFSFSFSLFLSLSFFSLWFAFPCSLFLSLFFSFFFLFNFDQ